MKRKFNQINRVVALALFLTVASLGALAPVFLPVQTAAACADSENC
jgi:hypothetical protein